MDLSLGNGYTAQIFSGELHLDGRSQPLIQFRVRDTRRGRVWTFRIQLTDVASIGGDGPQDHLLLSVPR